MMGRVNGEKCCVSSPMRVTYSLAVVSERVREVISLACCSSRVALLGFSA
jgi:hypothetical protein